MLNQFQADYFTFNGVNSRDKNFMMCTIDEKKGDVLFGLDREVEKEDGVGDIPTIINVKSKCPSFDVTIIKVINNQVIPFTNEDLNYIRRWLFLNVTKQFIVDNIIYYVIFTASRKSFLTASQGYITLTMESASPCGYSNIMVNPINVSEGKSKTLTISNKSNINKDVLVDIEIEMGEDATDIEITNDSTGETVSFVGLTERDEKHIMLEYEQNKRVYSKTNEDIVLLSKMVKKDWISLMYGVNKITVKANGMARVNIIYQYEMAW